MFPVLLLTHRQQITKSRGTAFDRSPASVAVFREGYIPMDITESSGNHEEAIIRLTKREIEVLQLVLEGKSSKEVALALCCSKRTIDFHLARIYDKLEVTNRVQAMRRATLLGLIPTVAEGTGRA